MFDTTTPLVWQAWWQTPTPPTPPLPTPVAPFPLGGFDDNQFQLQGMEVAPAVAETPLIAEVPVAPMDFAMPSFTLEQAPAIPEPLQPSIPEPIVEPVKEIPIPEPVPVPVAPQIVAPTPVKETKKPLIEQLTHRSALVAELMEYNSETTIELGKEQNISYQLEIAGDHYLVHKDSQDGNRNTLHFFFDDQMISVAFDEDLIYQNTQAGEQLFFGVTSDQIWEKVQKFSTMLTPLIVTIKQDMLAKSEQEKQQAIKNKLRDF